MQIMKQPASALRKLLQCTEADAVNMEWNGKVPLINVVASCVALVLMSLIIFQDNQGTLLTVCPLETLCLPAHTQETSPTSPQATQPEVC